MDYIAKWIILLSCIPVFAATGYAALFYKKLKKELQVFSWFLFLSGLVQLVSVILWWYNINNMPLLHLYVAAGFVCLAWFYKTVLGDFIDRRIIPGITIAFLVFTLFNSLFIQSVFTFNSHALTVESVIVIILSFSTFMLSLNEHAKDAGMPVLKSLNWINSGLFIYYTSSLLIFYFGASITRFFPVYLNRYTWVLHSFFSVVMYSCFFIGLCKNPRN